MWVQLGGHMAETHACNEQEGSLRSEKKKSACRGSAGEKGGHLLMRAAAGNDEGLCGQSRSLAQRVQHRLDGLRLIVPGEIVDDRNMGREEILRGEPPREEVLRQRHRARGWGAQRGARGSRKNTQERQEERQPGGEPNAAAVG